MRLSCTFSIKSLNVHIEGRRYYTPNAIIIQICNIIIMLLYFMSAVRVVPTRWVFVFDFVRVGKRHVISETNNIIKTVKTKRHAFHYNWTIYKRSSLQAYEITTSDMRLNYILLLNNNMYYNRQVWPFNWISKIRLLQLAKYEYYARQRGAESVTVVMFHFKVYTI